MSRFVASAAVVVLFVSTSRAADVPLAENAALHYWQAIAALPDREKYPDEQKKRFDEWMTCPLDDAARAVVKSHSTTLLQLHRGAALPNCAWGLNNDHPRDG